MQSMHHQHRFRASLIFLLLLVSLQLNDLHSREKQKWGEKSIVKAKYFRMHFFRLDRRSSQCRWCSQPNKVINAEYLAFRWFCWGWRTGQPRCLYLPGPRNAVSSFGDTIRQLGDSRCFAEHFKNKDPVETRKRKILSETQNKRWMRKYVSGFAC